MCPRDIVQIMILIFATGNGWKYARNVWLCILKKNKKYDIFVQFLPNDDPAQEWRHWLQTKTFIAVLPQENLNKLGLLINFVSPKIYESISECTTYDDALTTLQSQFVKPTNEVFARHRLATRRQEPGESLDVHRLSIRRRKTQESYGGAPSTRLLSAAHENTTNVSDLESESVLAASATKAKCFFCGLLRHPRSKCPARDAVCHKCQKKGHFSKVCRSSSVSGSVTPNNSAMLATITSAATPSILSKAVARVSINGIEADGLIDSGSSESFIHPDLVKRHSLNVQHSKSAVTMASTSLSAHTSGVCKVNGIMKVYASLCSRSYVLT
ncbi:uncharacterized protein [Penaeus vannamei]|uniref:uncharacterized protein n=1 Tax=Penaeus vannamei TaxID=6689 RepID=UPI00387F81C5